MKNANVYDVLCDLRATSGRNDKISILQKNKSNELLKSVFEYALNPFKNFYIRKIPKYTPSKKSVIELNHALSCLDKLIQRELTGHAAIDYLRDELLSRLSENDASVLECVIEKDLKCGVSDSTANKVWKDLIPTYPCMLASGFEQRLIDDMVFPAIAQIKLDGMRFNAIVNTNTASVDFRSRNGKPIAIKGKLLLSNAFLQMAFNIGMDEVVFDGELLVVNDSGKVLNRQEGNGVLNKAVKGTISDEESDRIRACVWDVIPLKSFLKGHCPVAYKDRLATVVVAVDNLGENLKYLVHVVETKFAEDAYRAQKIFESYYKDGQEGIILKNPEGFWEDKRVKHQIKYKGELECDLEVVEYVPGTGKYKGMLGSLVLKSADAKVNVSVGTGFSDAQRNTLKPKDVLGKIVAVKYNSLIENVDGEKSLFLPVFVEIREDKAKADSLKDLK